MMRFFRIALLVLAIVVIAAVAWTAKELYSPHKGYTGSLILVIPPGTRGPQVASLLASRGVLAHRLPFLVRYWLGRREHETLKFGEYQFDRPLTVIQVYQKLAKGEVYLHTVVIPEGSDRFDMARIYQREIGLDPTAFLVATSDPSLVRDIDPSAPSLEGFLFPDTYRFPRGVAARKVVETMVARFREVLKSELDSPSGITSIHDVVTLASLVEKETPNPGERSMIAGVFTRRLAKGMDLDCDPTVIYAIRLAANSADRFTGPITRSDLNTPSPYNTYVHAGLPPGPISSPGVASLKAALDPAGGRALYFVSNNHGGHVFSDTLAEQHRNVVRYREEKASGNRKAKGETSDHR